MPQPHWICDFCSDPEPHWLYRASTIEFKDISAESNGGWSACVICSDLIERGKREELAERAAEMMLRKHPEFEREELVGQVTYLHDRFFEHRIDGPPLRLPKPANANSFAPRGVD